MNVKCGCETCRFGVYNCTYSHHCNSGPAPTAIQNKLFSPPSSLSLYLSFLLKVRGATITKRRSSDGLAAWLKAWGRQLGGGGGEGGCYRNGADVNVLSVDMPRRVRCQRPQNA